jgi:hypothetical protein
MDMKTPRRLGSIATIGLVENKDAFFIGTKELEDAFCDDVWAHALQKFHPVDSGQPQWQPADISSLRSKSKFSDSLVDLVNSRCPSRGSASKPDLGISVANACIELSHIPPVLTDLFSELAKSVTHL